MKSKFIGAVSVFVGLFTLMGVAGTVTDLPADVTIDQIVTMVGIGFTGAMLAQLGIWMMEDKV